MEHPEFILLQVADRSEASADLGDPPPAARRCARPSRAHAAMGAPGAAGVRGTPHRRLRAAGGARLAGRRQRELPRPRAPLRPPRSIPAAAWAPHHGHFPPLFPLLLAPSRRGAGLPHAHARGRMLRRGGARARLSTRLRGRGIAGAISPSRCRWPSCSADRVDQRAGDPERAALPRALAWRRSSTTRQRLARSDARVATRSCWARSWAPRCSRASRASRWSQRCVVALAISRGAAPAGSSGASLLPRAAGRLPRSRSWLALRPSRPSDPYERATHAIAATWLADIRSQWPASPRDSSSPAGWRRSPRDASVALAVRLLVAALGALGLAGAARRRLGRNRLTPGTSR